MADLSQRLFRLSAELGDLHLKRRVFERQRAAIDGQLAQGDALIATKEHEIEVIRQLRAEAKAEADAAKNAPPTLPDVPERPHTEGAPDVATPLDAAPDRPATSS
jgi:hypothetical protein